eukprot:10626969-Alexandrium_andersonii.AAC.1
MCRHCEEGQDEHRGDRQPEAGCVHQQELAGDQAPGMGLSQAQCPRLGLRDPALSCRSAGVAG